MGQRFLIDTNILIDAQMKKLPLAGDRFLEEVINKEFIVSFVTYIEFMGYREITKSMEDFVSLAQVLQISDELIEICIGIRKEIKTKLPDAIIAATAIAYNLTLVTRNVRDFQNIPNLKMVNPWNL